MEANGAMHKEHRYFDAAKLFSYSLACEISYLDKFDEKTL